jgi:hypothetical protein
MKVHITAKCDDRFQARVPELRINKQGYVARGLGIGGGDYIRFTLDTETGKIENWTPLTDDVVTELLCD